MTPPKFDPILEEAIRVKAKQFSLPLEMLAAMVVVESSGNSKATRYEPHYHYLWDCARKRPVRSEVYVVPPPGLQTNRPREARGQKTSWGPLQIMGAVAREAGFNDAFEELLGPLGLYYGCLHLSRYRDRYIGKFGLPGVVAAYNAGSPRMGKRGFENQDYVNKVSRWAKYFTEHPL